MVYSLSFWHPLSIFFYSIRNSSSLFASPLNNFSREHFLLYLSSWFLLVSQTNKINLYIRCWMVLFNFKSKIGTNFFITWKRHQNPILKHAAFHPYSDDRYTLYKKRFCGSVTDDKGTLMKYNKPIKELLHLLLRKREGSIYLVFLVNKIPNSTIYICIGSIHQHLQSKFWFEKKIVAIVFFKTNLKSLE